MTQQLAIDFSMPSLERARAARDAGMARVEDKAGPDFASRAYDFLVDYATRRRYVNPEEVCDLAAADGIVVHDTRAWGGIYQKAVRLGVIERSNVPYQRRKGHATVALLWRSMVYL